MAVRVSLNGLEFNTGDGWSVDVEGLGGAGVSVESGQRVQADGQWSTTAYRSGAAMGLSGLVRLSAVRDVPAVVAALEAAVSLEPSPLTVHWASGDRTRRVRRDGRVVVTPHGSGVVAWSCTVVADDPHWYSGGPGYSLGAGLPPFPASDWETANTALPSSTGGLSLPFSLPFSIDATVVSGDMSVSTVSGGWWIFIVRSDQDSLQSPRLIVTGADGVQRTLAWDGLSLNAGEFLMVDPQNHTALLQGQATRVPSSRQWPTLGPGSTLVQFRADNYVAAVASAFWVPFA